MKLSICFQAHHQPSAERLAAHLGQALAAETVLCSGEFSPTALDDSDAVIGLWAAEAAPLDWLTHTYLLAPVIMLVQLDDDRPVSLPLPHDLLRVPLRADSWAADLAQLTSQLRVRLQRRAEARHEYNNIAAVVALSQDASVLARAREALIELRTRYPEYRADPDGLNAALELD